MIIDEKVRKYTARLFGAGILVLAVWFVLAPKKEFSENENRYLTKMPSFTAKTVFSGEYTESLSDWIADHFPMRDLFMGVKTEVEIVSGRREINRIYIGEDNYLIERYEAPENTERITDTLVKFYDRVKDTGVDVRLMLVPTAVTIYEDKLPAYAPEADQMETAKLLYEATGIPAVENFWRGRKKDRSITVQITTGPPLGRILVIPPTVRRKGSNQCLWKLSRQRP